MKKFILPFLFAASLFCCCPEVNAAAPQKKPSHPIFSRYNIKPGDVLVVEMWYNNKPILMLVRVNNDYNMDYFFNGKIYSFQPADLDVFDWEFYIKN